MQWYTQNAVRAGARTIAAVVAAAACSPGASADADAGRADSFEVVAEADRLAAADLWPGFDLRVIPVAIYDGEQTLLFRHPSPPDGFRPVPHDSSVSAFAGRHPAVVANTSAELGGVQTATIVAAGKGSPPELTGLAGLLVHESFHVFQRERHPEWAANEAELFTYSVTDPELLGLRRSETEALRRALAAEGDDALCWARTALDLRSRRFDMLPEGALTYERMIELVEGLASYVELRAKGEPDGAVLPAQGYAPEDVRQRAYGAGVALARLLDGALPEWRAVLTEGNALSLDTLLSRTLDYAAADGDNDDACALGSAQQEGIRAAAEADVETLRGQLDDKRRDFLDQPGWRLVVHAQDSPLTPRGFDPVNVQVVASGEILHSRFLRLGSDAGEIEILDRPSLTEAAGAHPLYNGVRTVTVTGLDVEPEISETDGTINISADGVSATFRGAAVESEEHLVKILLGRDGLE